MAQGLPICLSMLTMDDADDHLAAEDEELVRWLNGGPGTSATVSEYLQRCADWWQAGGPTFAFGIRAGDPPILAGTVEVQFDQLGLQPGHVNISYGVYAAWRRRGVASQAVELACEFAQARGARQAVIRVEPLNQASIAVARRCGFTCLYTTNDGTELQWWVRDLAQGVRSPAPAV